MTCTKLGTGDGPRPRTKTKIRPPISEGRLNAAGELDLDSMGNRSLARLLCQLQNGGYAVQHAATCDGAQSPAGFDSDSFDPLGLKRTTK